MTSSQNSLKPVYAFKPVSFLQLIHFKHTLSKSSLLKMFLMFEIRLSCGDDDLDKVCLKCVNCRKETGLNAETGFKEFMMK